MAKQSEIPNFAHIVVWRKSVQVSITTRPDIIIMGKLAPNDPPHIKGSSYAIISESIIAKKVGAFT
jgi:hypothetical protein